MIVKKKCDVNELIKIMLCEGIGSDEIWSVVGDMVVKKKQNSSTARPDEIFNVLLEAI